MNRIIRKLKQRENEPFRIPSKVQDILPIRCAWEDGVFQVGKKFSRTYRFTDVNYQVASKEDQESMFLQYSDLLNALDSEATAKITISNHPINRISYEEAILLSLCGDSLDEYRQEVNQMLMDKAMGSHGLVQEKFITTSVVKKNIEEARNYFARVGTEYATYYGRLGSRCTELDVVERLRIIHDFFWPEHASSYHLDFKDMVRKGHDFRDYICPDSVEKNSDYLRLGKRYARVLYLKDYATFVKDSMVTELTNLNRQLMLSIDICPVSTDESMRIIENIVMGVEKNINDWQRRQNANNNFSAIIPYDMELRRKEAREYINDVNTRDQRMMFAVLTMVHVADSKEELDQDTETILAIARSHMCQMAVLRYQQLDGLQTVLPFGIRKIDAFRTLTTESVAVLMPFKVQEIMDRGGIYFGENAISHNLILCNLENLMNQSTFILGVPGSGKSFTAKLQIFLTLLSTGDDILICDPEGEYASMLRGIDNVTIANISASGGDRLNAMYMEEGYGGEDPLVEKSQFIMSLLERIDKTAAGAKQHSIIDRCVEYVYEDAKKSGQVPTLCDLREKLLEQPNPLAQDIALALELYTRGSLNIFGRESTVDLNKRVVVFDIHGLGEQLKPAGLLVITDTMLNRVAQNWKKGKRTHVIIDEFHVVFENEFSAAFFNSAWRQFRKRNAYPTAITQNVEYLLDSVQASTMISNSEFIVMLNQAPKDREKLGELLNISDEQMSYVTNTEPGCGLIRYGGAVVPFVNRFPKNTKMYQRMTTRPGEGDFAGGQA